MNDMQSTNRYFPIEWKGQVVITSARLADVYGTTTKNISNNFNRNKERFEEGKHYFVLQGDELKEFMRLSSESGIPSFTPFIYVWTRRGASRHCKILGTDKAWEQFDYLEDNYFEQKSTPQLPQNPMQLLTLHYEAIKQVDGKVERLEERFYEFEHGLPLFPSEADSISDMVKKKVVSCLGGKESNAYRNASIRRRTFIDAYQHLKRNFNVRTYKSIKRSQCDRAMTIVEQYQLPVFLADEIEQCNLQMTLNDC